MNNNNSNINLHQLVIERIEDHLAVQLESEVSKASAVAESKELKALASVLSYPPIAYLTKSPEYITDIESLDDSSRNWIINFVNYVTLDWSMMIRTINCDSDYMDSFMAAFNNSLLAVTETSITMDGYNDRLDETKVSDPVALTYYMLASCYRRIALRLGIAHGRATSKPAN